MLWRAEILVDHWSEELAAHALANHVQTSAPESEGEVVVTCTFETDEGGIGAAMFELTQRLSGHLELSMTDFGSLEMLAD